METKQLRAELRRHTEGLSHVAFSPDGKSVITSSWDDTARVWQIRDTALRRLDPDARDLQSDGQLVLTVVDNAVVHLWEPAGGHLRFALPRSSTSISTHWQAPVCDDGRYIITASFDATAKIWEAASGRALITLGGHPGTVYAASMTPDHRHVLTLTSSAVRASTRARCAARPRS